MAQNGDVESVDFDNEEAILLIVPVDGYVYQGDGDTAYTKETDSDGNPRFIPIFDFAVVYKKELDDGEVKYGYMIYKFAMKALYYFEFWDKEK